MEYFYSVCMQKDSPHGIILHACGPKTSKSCKPRSPVAVSSQAYNMYTNGINKLVCLLMVSSLLEIVGLVGVLASSSVPFSPRWYKHTQKGRGRHRERGGIVTVLTSLFQGVKRMICYRVCFIRDESSSGYPQQTRRLQQGQGITDRKI